MKVLIILILVTAVALADEEPLQAFIKANNLFASAAYKEVLKDSPGNFLVSPLSAETALAFAQSGCKDETAQEIRSALRLPDDKSKIEDGIRSLLPQLKGGDNYALHSANKMYIKEDFTVKEEFRKVATEVFQAGSESIDFIKRDQAAETMNKWVEKQTNNKIHDLIQSQNLNNRTRLVLINALYFKGDWSSPFLLSESKRRKFYKTAKDTVEVDMMNHYYVHRQYFNYYECPHLNAKFLELPFKGEDACMTIILPNEKEGLAALENEIERVFTPHNLTKHLVNIALPKFRIESKINLKKILQNLGVSKAFDDKQADLSGIAGKKGDLIISKAKQKTFIDVSEEGVEAAAATYVEIAVPLSAIRDPIKNFIADHPFIFYIKVKGVIVFAGRVTEP